MCASITLVVPLGLLHLSFSWCTIHSFFERVSLYGFNTYSIPTYHIYSNIAIESSDVVHLYALNECVRVASFFFVGLFFVSLFSTCGSPHIYSTTILITYGKPQKLQAQHKSFYGQIHVIYITDMSDGRNLIVIIK